VAGEQELRIERGLPAAVRAHALMLALICEAFDAAVMAPHRPSPALSVLE